MARTLLSGTFEHRAIVIVEYLDKATYVPGDVGFSTKPRLAVKMIERAIAASVPFRWVAADTVYGVGDIERDLRRAGKGYVLGVGANRRFTSWGKPRRIAGTAEEIAKTQRPSDWRRLSAGAGTKGPRLHDWCYFELADLEGNEFNDNSHGLWTRGLLIRHSYRQRRSRLLHHLVSGRDADQDAGQSRGASLGDRGQLRDRQNEFGLDHNETRSWHGWHRHVSLVMLAFAMMAAIHYQANKSTPKKTKPVPGKCRPCSSAGRSRRSVE